MRLLYCIHVIVFISTVTLGAKSKVIKVITATQLLYWLYIIKYPLSA